MKKESPHFIGQKGEIFWFIRNRKDKEEIRKQQSLLEQRWQQAMSRWEKLYYCGRDDIIYIPGEKTSAQVSDINTYIYSSPKQ